MSFSQQIAKHFRDVHFGGNWTDINLQDTLSDITWQQAITQVYSFNTIATLTYHTHYFVHVVLKVLQGGPLEANDKFSFDHPPINTQEDWEQFLETVFTEARQFADLVEELPDEKLLEDFTDKKYNNYYYNLNGIIEHTHYHLGQIILIKKIFAEKSNK